MPCLRQFSLLVVDGEVCRLAASRPRQRSAKDRQGAAVACSGSIPGRRLMFGRLSKHCCNADSRWRLSTDLFHTNRLSNTPLTRSQPTRYVKRNLRLLGNSISFNDCRDNMMQAIVITRSSCRFLWISANFFALDWHGIFWWLTTFYMGHFLVTATHVSRFASLILRCTEEKNPASNFIRVCCKQGNYFHQTQEINSKLSVILQRICGRRRFLHYWFRWCKEDPQQSAWELLEHRPLHFMLLNLCC